MQARHSCSLSTNHQWFDFIYPRAPTLSAGTCIYDVHIISPFLVCKLPDDGLVRLELSHKMVILFTVFVVVVFTLKTVLTSIQYLLFFTLRQRNEFPWSQANPK